MILYTTRIYLSKHAKDRMNERGLKYDDVVESISNPKQLVYDKWNDVYIAVSITGSAVVYAFKGGKVEVLTVLSRREYEALMSKYGTRRYKILT